ncbi:MAG TPA: hypothetical protein VL092_04880, partial [Chitinophagaceae bacterium]|nr:hypothetical protein [Chitinophagaceae bacterium]
MINRYFPQFLKCSLLALAMGPVFSASGQTTVTIGSGTTAAALTPIFSCMDYSYAQMIYTAAEISTAGGGTTLGAVTKIRFYLSAGASTNSDNWTVYMGHTTKSTFSSTSDWIAVSSLTSVFSGTVSYPSGS